MAKFPSGQVPAVDQARLRHYLDEIARCMHECAEHQGERQDVFLWNARRTAEAVLYALAEGTEHAALVQNLGEAKKPPETTVLAEKLTQTSPPRLHKGMLAHVSQIRWAGNLGAHVQHAGDQADPVTMRECADSLCKLVTWVFDKSELKREKSAKLADAIDDLEADTPRRSQLQLLKDDLNRTTQQLKDRQQEVAYWRDQAQMATIQTGQTKTTVEPHRRPLVTVLACLSCIAAGALAGAHWPGRESPVAPPSLAMAAAASAAPPKSSPTLARVPAKSADESPAVLPDALAAAAPDAATLPTPIEPAPPLLVVPEPSLPLVAPEAAVVTSCPAGTLAFKGHELALDEGPSSRSAWGKPLGLPQAAHVPDFCLDRELVSAGALLRSLRERGDYVPPAKSNQALGVRHLPANWVTWQQANDYCRAQGKSLPSVAQWEVAARSSAFRALGNLEPEWVADAFPASAIGLFATPTQAYKHFHYGVANRIRKNWALLAWHRRKATDPGLPNLSFRCVSDPKRGTDE